MSRTRVHGLRGRYRFRGLCVFANLVVLITATVSASRGDTFVRVADSSTPLPEGGGNFTSFAGELLDETQMPPAIDGENVVFAGHGSGGQHGLYLWRNGVISVIADSNTPIPGGSGTFSGYQSATISGGNVAFQGLSPGNAIEGVYLASGGALTRVADQNMVAPGSSEKFRGFAVDPSANGSDVFISAGVGMNLAGIYRFHDGSLSVVADLNTSVPGGTGNFTSLNTNLVGKNGNVLFTGYSSATANGVYGYVGGSLVRIADQTTPAPDGSGTFGHFDNIVLGYDGTTAVFFSGGVHATSGGLYASQAGSIRRIALTTDPAPGGGTFDFNNLTTVAVSGGNLAFIGQSGSLYADVNGAISRVVGEHDTFFGKTVEDVHINPDGLSGNDLVFVVRFTDMSSGVYLATLPEPALCALLPMTLALTRRRRGLLH